MDTCDFPGCDKDTPHELWTRCLLHVNVMVSSSYLNADEIADE